MTEPVDRHQHHKSVLAPFRAALYDFDLRQLADVCSTLFDPDCRVRMAYPFEEVSGGSRGLIETVYTPLVSAIPDLERRDTIVMAGPAGDSDWVGCAGYYTGTFRRPWLDIPPSHHQVSLRFHEFYCFREGRIIEVQSLWDIPEVMMQAGVWPLSPSLGREWHVPGPAPQDGLIDRPWDEALSTASTTLVSDMLDALKRYPSEPPEAMELEKYWHPKMNWYGPSGIGTNRLIQGFRRLHQTSFVEAMPDRGRHDAVPSYLFGDGNYVGFTAWPGMEMSMTVGGWLGIPPHRHGADHAQPRFLALRERTDSRELGAGRRTRRLPPTRRRRVQSHARVCAGNTVWNRLNR